MQSVTFHVPAISCKHCVHTISTELSDLEGVTAVEGSVETKDVKVSFDLPATPEKMKKVLEEINYPAA